MMRFIESIRVENKQISNRTLHRQRFFDTINFHYGHQAARAAQVQFDELLNNILRKNTKRNQVQKLRLIYADRILHFELQDYHPRIIQSLKLVICDHLEYKFKYYNRDVITNLFNQRAGCDDILICCNGYITDSSFSNLVFENQDGLFTPKTFLLNGTRRQSLLDEGIIKEADISIDKLKDYDRLILINAMLPLGSMEAIPLQKAIAY